ncbi:hypothetical protein KS4_07910 [Poriferisphaera corsica]|uniref:Uncharacterized protein n=1 Tax=Poriferisphaera corsica TaxID=2528020 RepID=A0A517YRA9_9BACT|nr:hypothetical protein [Poriferisphaera corsica]QDU32757.1 hypothetical protein KS4_07910 [Poriferisphaera corsica]
MSKHHAKKKRVHHKEPTRHKLLNAVLTNPVFWATSIIVFLIAVAMM